MKKNKAVVFMVMVFMAVAALLADRAGAEEAWWEDSIATAGKHGYHVVDQKGLEKLLTQTPPPLTIDVRPDYEFRGGHIPGAVNLEFDLGDNLQLHADKQQRFLTLAGPDRERQIVIYCRSLS